MPYFILLLLGLLLTNCTSSSPSPAAPPAAPTAEDVIRRAIDVHGGTAYDSLSLSFDFRNRSYAIDRRGGRYRYERSFSDTLADGTVEIVTDRLDNDRLLRYRDGRPQELSAKDSSAYAESVNSVRYFFMLPFGLLDPAVNRELLDTVTIRRQPYVLVRVTFDETGGGTDFQDVYHYYFHLYDHTLDYLAYSFLVNDGGIRFREAVNRRRAGPLLIQDYVNYGLNETTDLTDVAGRFERGELRRLSTIENRNVVLR